MIATRTLLTLLSLNWALSSLSQPNATTKLNSTIPKTWKTWVLQPISPSLAETERNMTVNVGETVQMPCTVDNLHDKTISWIRGVDLTVLAVDDVTYTGDQRFSVIHSEGSSDWILELTTAVLTDEGIYDCQVNTYPKVSTKIYLDVIPKYVPSSLQGRSKGNNNNASSISWEDTDALGPGIILKINSRAWVHTDIGSNLNISCEASGRWVLDQISSGNAETLSSTGKQIIGWNLDDVPVGVLFPEWKFRIEETWRNSSFISKLTLNTVAPEDSGKLTCLAPGTKASSINFNVKHEESSKQHYRGYSSSKEDPAHPPHPVTSAVSDASPAGGYLYRKTFPRRINLLISIFLTVRYFSRSNLT